MAWVIARQHGRTGLTFFQRTTRRGEWTGAIPVTPRFATSQEAQDFIGENPDYFAGRDVAPYEFKSEPQVTDGEAHGGIALVPSTPREVVHVDTEVYRKNLLAQLGVARERNDTQEILELEYDISLIDGHRQADAKHAAETPEAYRAWLATELATATCYRIAHETDGYYSLELRRWVQDRQEATHFLRMEQAALMAMQVGGTWVEISRGVAGPPVGSIFLKPAPPLQDSAVDRSSE